MKKRGLSNLVATVLIVLLALAAVGLVWAYLKPAFDKTGVQTELRTQCISINVEPVSCVYNSTDSMAYVNVKLTAGEISEVIAVLEFGDETTMTNQTVAPAILETKKVYFDTDGQEGVSARVAGVVSDGVNFETCQESQDVVCEVVA